MRPTSVEQHGYTTTRPPPARDKRNHRHSLTPNFFLEWRLGTQGRSKCDMQGIRKAMGNIAIEPHNCS
eukprot:5964023-Amphidinium_carterae.1